MFTNVPPACPVCRAAKPFHGAHRHNEYKMVLVLQQCHSNTPTEAPCTVHTVAVNQGNSSKSFSGQI